MSPHGFVHYTCFQVVKDGVMVLGGPGTLHKLAELVLQRLPAHLHASLGQHLICPLLKSNVCCGVEGAWWVVGEEEGTVLC